MDADSMSSVFSFSAKKIPGPENWDADKRKNTQFFLSAFISVHQRPKIMGDRYICKKKIIRYLFLFLTCRLTLDKSHTIFIQA